MLLQLKNAPAARDNRGSILFVSLAIIIIAALGAGALLSTVQQESRLTHHTIAWRTALPIAEAGAEEALAHVNQLNGSTNFQTDGWTLNPTNGTYQKQRTVGEGSFVAEIVATNQPIIRSRGVVRTPLQNETISRTVQVNTRRGSFPGIEAIDKIRSSGGITDSFDSDDPNFSSNGFYDPAKAKDNARFATLSGARNKIDIGGRLIYGYVATGSGGSVSVGTAGKVGSKAWIQRSDTRGKIEPGHSSANYKGKFPPHTAPFTTGLKPQGPAAIGTNSYQYIFGNGDYSMSKLIMSGTEQAIVVGRARLLITDEFELHGQSQLIISAGATLEIYFRCPSVTVNGRGIINNHGRASALKLFGLPSNTKISLQGTADFIGVIDAPKAEVRLGGSSTYYGHVRCYSAEVSGANGFHGDEACCPKTFAVLSWREVR